MQRRKMNKRGEGMRLRIRSTGAWVAAQRDLVFSPHPFQEGVQVTAERTVTGCRERKNGDVGGLQEV